MTFVVEQLQDQEVCPAGDVLGRAFQTDPLYSFAIPNADHRRCWLPIFKRQLIVITQPHRRNYVARDEQGQIAGALVMTPPGKFPHSLAANLRLFWTAVMRPTPWRPSLVKLWPIRRYAETFNEIHYRGPHWYIDVIGVDPQRQGQGVGRLLMARAIELATESAMPIWLETQTESNVGYYESLGFAVTVKRQPTPQGPPTWGMLRPA